MKNTLVWCKTKAQVLAVLTKAKKKEYSVPNLDEFAERLWNTTKSKTVINLNGDGVITHCYKEWYEKHSEYGNIITAEKFLGTKPILITRNGKLTIAEDKNTGEKGIAACSPDDTYDFGTGALIAVARLVAKDSGISGDAGTVLRKLLGDDVKSDVPAKSEFKVGDRVIIRDWDDLVSEYGVNSPLGVIDPEGLRDSFTDSMKYLCGKTATINGFDDESILLEFDDGENHNEWNYETWMLNHLEGYKPTTKFKVGDLVTLKNGLELDKTYGNMTLYHGDMFDSLSDKPKKVKEVWERSTSSPSYRTEDDWYYSEEMLEKWDESKIREGDKVYVSSASLNYAYYTEWVYEHITDSDLTKRFGYGGSIMDKDKLYEVVKIAPHKNGQPMLAYIRPYEDTLGSCHLIDVDGLKKAKE